MNLTAAIPLLPPGRAQTSHSSIPGRREGKAGLDAAGAIVWRLEKNNLEVLLVHRPRYDDWSWPKGKLEPGEDPISCAWREVLEETGRQVVIGRPLPKVSYPLADGQIKTVFYWAARLASDRDNPAICARQPVPVSSRHEVDRSAWFSFEQALRRLTSATDRLPLLKLRQYFDRGKLVTRPVVIIRHAQAENREGWTKADGLRPLTTQGRERARSAVPLLAAVGIRRVISSPWTRCRQTVRPFASRARLAVNTSRWLTEAAAKDHPARAIGLMRRILRGGPPVVICSHRPVLPLLLGVIDERAARKVRHTLAVGPLATGEAAIAHTVRTRSGRIRVVALDRVRPPLPS
jgi:8-oxo-dGTP diphosphatase